MLYEVAEPNGLSGLIWLQIEHLDGNFQMFIQKGKGEFYSCFSDAHSYIMRSKNGILCNLCMFK
uniref:Uncharacterized protein n=1 Tax=Arundo donax TaxID=35708 RepID=A0A0A8Y8G0_ARUDO